MRTDRRRSIERAARRAGLALALALGVLACDDGDAAAPTGPPCDAERNGWEYCVDDAVQWCHVGGDAVGGHLHAGKDCAADGLVCREGEDHLAYCAPVDAACTPGEAGECVDGDAMNCVDGLWGTRRCGVGRQCEVRDTWAVCAER